MKNLRKDIRVYEEKASREAMQSVNVVLCTLTSATDDGPLRLLQANHFDLVVIDECSQVDTRFLRVGRLGSSFVSGTRSSLLARSTTCAQMCPSG